jgi:hypothetical protein
MSNTRKTTSLFGRLTEEALDNLVTKDLADFASHVETARTIWRKYPEWVEAPVFPEQLHAAFVEEEGHEPSDDCALAGEEALEPGHRETRREDAIKIAESWMERGRAPRGLRLSPEETAQHDAEFLSNLGISLTKASLSSPPALRLVGRKDIAEKDNGAPDPGTRGA